MHSVANTLKLSVLGAEDCCRVLFLCLRALAEPFLPGQVRAILGKRNEGFDTMNISLFFSLLSLFYLSFISLSLSLTT